MNSPLFKLERIKKSYEIAGVSYPVLQGIDMTVNKGDFIALMGPSGSGKSTLLNIIGCLDVPSGGSYWWESTEVSKLKSIKLAEIRNMHIGFIFQNFNLIPTLTVKENVMLPGFYLGEENEGRAEELLIKVGLGEKLARRPNELSGGQRQRVAIARALMNNPELVLADEPTGALDSKTGKEIMEIIKDLNKVNKKTILMVTHDINIAHSAHRIINLADGKIKNE
jgi:putative ABC transport system ATP-binding protein